MGGMGWAVRVRKKDSMECLMQSELGIKLAYCSINARDVEKAKVGEGSRRGEQGAHGGSKWGSPRGVSVKNHEKTPTSYV